MITEAEVLPLATALGGGFLIGVERERRKGHGAHRSLAGVRTFPLAALAGTIAQQVHQPALVAGGALLILTLTATAYWKNRSADPGITTELALFVTFVLGVAAVDHTAAAAAGYVLVAALLAARSGLHRFSTQLLTTRELTEALVLAGAALVILPLVPDANLSWLGGLNPRRIWTLAVTIMTLEAAGYVGMRTVGSIRGLAISGLSSGFVSSTATIAALGARARVHPILARACAAGGLFSTVATFIQLGVIAAVSHPPSLVGLLAPLACGLTATLLTAALTLHGAGGPAPAVPSNSRAFRAGQALGVAVALAALTTVVGVAHVRFGTEGAILSAALAGFADVHAAAAAVLSLAAGGQIDGATLRSSILVALAANTVSKLAAAAWSGGPAFVFRLAPGLLFGTAAAWLGNRIHW